MIKFWFDKFKIGRASHRLRAHHPNEVLRFRNIDSKITNNLHDLSQEDIVIFTKDSDIENMRKIKRLGIIVGFDLCDNKFEENRQLYQSYCNEVNFITVNSKTMQFVVKEETGKESFYYTDPCDRKITAPTVNLSTPIKLVWYGGSSSNKYVDWVRVIQSLKKRNISYELTICVDKCEKLRNKLIPNFQRTNLEKEIGNIKHVEWTWDEQQRLVENSDIVFIPILGTNAITERRTKTKSYNRLVDGLAMGKFVVSSLLPGYIPLKDFCWLGDPGEGVDYYINNVDKVKKQILEAQAWISKNASPEIAADQLLDIYRKVKG